MRQSQRPCSACEGRRTVWVCPGCGAPEFRHCNASSMECWDAGNWHGGHETTCPACDGSGVEKDESPQPEGA